MWLMWAIVAVYCRWKVAVALLSYPRIINLIASKKESEFKRLVVRYIELRLSQSRLKFQAIRISTFKDQ